jgi:hypothetical protein
MEPEEDLTEIFDEGGKGGRRISDSEKADFADIYFNDGDILKAKETYKDLLESKRPAVRERAAKFILKHHRELHKVDKPQKVEHEHKWPDEVKVKVFHTGADGNTDNI